MMPARRRAMLLAGAMVGTAVLAAAARPRSLRPGEVPDPRLETLFPGAFANWQTDPLSSAFVRSADQQGRVLGIYDRLLERTYIDAEGYRVMLSVAYLARALEGSSVQLHRPEVCYRYSGYEVGATSEEMISLGERQLRSTRLLARLPGRTEPITYWFVVGDEVVGDAADLRKRRILAGLRRETFDGMLVRISSIDLDTARAYQRQTQFASALMAALDASARRRVFGSLATA